MIPPPPTGGSDDDSVRWRLKIAYNGSGFHGFAAQDGQPTVAGAVETALGRICRTAVTLTCAGRTDSGVHALDQVVHFDVPAAVYDNLITAVRANLAPLFRYFQLRRRVLKLDEIHHYDTYVPIVSDLEMRTTFNDAIDLVLESLAPLGSEYTATLGAGLRSSRWCDRYESKGKRSGAFSSSRTRSLPRHSPRCSQ